MSLLIVSYHALCERVSPASTSVSAFEAALDGLCAADYRFVTLDHCANWLEGRSAMPSRAAVVTFDDAYVSVMDEALPVLQRLGVRATVFAIAGRLGCDNAWPGQWAGVPRLELLSAAGLRELVAAGMTIGSHGWTHRSLATLPRSRLEPEIVESADELEQRLGVEVRHFAYPYGHHTRTVRNVVASRYRSAVSVRPALVERFQDPFDLPRLDAHDLQVAVRFGLLGSPVLRPYVALRRGARRLRRVWEAGLADDRVE